MGQSKYRIFELSARAVMSYAAQENGQWHFALDRAATEKCKRVSALHEQDGNALFFQIMCVVQGDDFSEPTDDRPIEGLSDVIFYMDFSGIFDRSSTLPRQQIRQEKARDMFRPEGVQLDLGSGMHRYRPCPGTGVGGAPHAVSGKSRHIGRTSGGLQRRPPQDVLPYGGLSSAAGGVTVRDG